MTAGQRAAVALKMKPAIKEKAQSAKVEGGKNAGKNRSGKVSMNSSKPIDTRKEVAKIAGVSEDTVRKTEAVLKDGAPEVKAALQAGKITANAAFKETRRPSGGTKFDPSEWEGEREADVQPAASKVPDYLQEVVSDQAEFKSILATLAQIKGRLKSLSDKPGGSWLQRGWQDTERAIDQLRANIKFAQYYAPCPRCEGKHIKDCDRCKGRRWITVGMKNSISDIEKAWLSQG